MCGDREGCCDFFDFDFVFFGLEPLAEVDDFEDDVDETSSCTARVRKRGAGGGGGEDAPAVTHNQRHDRRHSLDPHEFEITKRSEFEIEAKRFLLV